jgi:hypothetical protein
LTAQRKAFFFEKKKQKTFDPKVTFSAQRSAKFVKVFCFFFSKKKALPKLACFTAPPAGLGTPAPCAVRKRPQLRPCKET